MLNEMCFVICASNIRVGIWLRGIHLVFMQVSIWEPYEVGLCFDGMVMMIQTTYSMLNVIL